MKTAASFTAEARKKAGTGDARALRREGRIPAIIYGAGVENPVQLSLEARPVEKEYHKGFFFNRLVDITVDGKTYHVLPKDLQLHPVTDKIEHADFYSVNKGSAIKVMIPVQFKNTERCIGIRRGGTLNVVRHEVELVCQPENIPQVIELDIKDAKIGDSLHISQIALPEGVTPAITDRDFTIATIAGRQSQEDDSSGSADGEDSKAEEKAGE